MFRDLRNFRDDGLEYKFVEWDRVKFLVNSLVWLLYISENLVESFLFFFEGN